MSARSIAHSTSAARADLDTELALPGDGRTVTTVASYLDHNKVFNVKDYGAVGDGTTDDATKIQDTIDAATTAGGGIVFFPFGAYKIASGLTVTKGLTLQGEGIPGGNADGVAMAFSRLLYTATDGTAITFDGSNSNSQGSGGGVIRLSIVQAGGTGTVNGTAIKLTGADVNHRVTWARIEDVQMEQLATSVPWDIGIDLDGTLIGSNGVRDVWIDRVRVVSDATATAAVRMQSAVNVFMANSHMNLNGEVSITGTASAPSSGIHLFGVNIDTLALDYVNDVELMGGQVATITNTANTGTSSNPVTLLPGKFTNGASYVNNASDHCGLFYYDYPSGTWVADGPIRLHNNRHYEGTKADGTTEVSLIGITSANRLSLDVGGLGVWSGTPQTQITNATGRLLGQSVSGATVNPTVSYTVLATDDTVRASASGGATVVTLPSAATISGKRYTIKKIDSSANTVTVTAAGAETIDGANTKVLSSQYASIMIQSNGANWDVLANA